MAAETEAKYLDRKRAAVRYLKDNEVPKRFQRLLNDVVVKRPDDIFGYMAEYFARESKPPTIANVITSEVFSTRRYPSFQVEIQALVHGNIMTLGSCKAPWDGKPAEAKPAVKGKSPAPVDSKLSKTDGQCSPEDPEDGIQAVIQNIHDFIKPLLLGCQLYDQEEINKTLEEIISQRLTDIAQNSTMCVKEDVSSENEKVIKEDEALPNDEMEPEEDSSTEPAVHLDILTISMALVQSASYLQKCQLYQYLYKTIHNEEPTSLSLPTPLMNVLRCDRRTAGKLYMFKDVMIFMKKNTPAMQSLKNMTEIYQQLELIVQQKPISNMMADNGALTPAVDKAEQGLDLIRDGISAAGYSFEEDVAVAITCACKDIYDKDKQKYEVSSNTFKSCDELINFYVDLCDHYPEIKVLVDPFAPEDRESFGKLSERIRGNCFLINQETFSNNCKVFGKILKKGFVSGNVVKTENVSTIHQFLEQTKTIEDCSRILFISPNEVDTDERFIVDVAVAVEADFLILGGPGRSENIGKYNRLLSIVNELNKRDLLVAKEPLLPHTTSPQTEIETEKSET
ncbi:enolase 4-like [Dendronephthya gigantea]|uniref:enolase 4-like n=1 Tax=Dendronephthya gigantea TaxID=151771 RepID=UPI00106ABC41|nr:enolase 4-like [Dendronephthya gigantea]